LSFPLYFLLFAAGFRRLIHLPSTQ
jgi:hypothetical protein